MLSVLAAVVVIACLYLGRVVFVPLALSIIVSFLLAPVVSLLERIKIPRVPSVVLVVTLVGIVFGAIGWNAGGQLKLLAYEFQTNSTYQDHIRSKIEDLRKFGSGGALTRFQETVDEITDEFSEAPAVASAPPSVIVREDATSSFVTAWESVKPALEPIGTAMLVLALAIFMLIHREDLRNRIISLFGSDKLMVTTRAIDDAGRRIGRYLLMQLFINATYGLILGSVLYAMGVPFALLWGFLAALLRYIPYIGPWLGATLPLATSLVAFPGWYQALWVLAVIVALELFSNMVMEPLLYGHSVGISAVALIVAAVFWTWIWGAIGLVLATPLTVCLLVLGQHVPQLRILAVLLGDEPALPPPMRYYQRLIARDEMEAADVVRDGMKEEADAFDQVVLPALVTMRRDRKQEALTAEDESYILKSTARILEELCGETRGEELEGGASEHAVGSEDPPAPDYILGCPAHHEAEELALRMLSYTLPQRGRSLRVTSTLAMYTEILAQVDNHRPAAVFIAVIPPSGLEQAAFLCEQLQKHDPTLPIVIGYWGSKRYFDRVLRRVRAVGAACVTTSLRQAEKQLMTYAGARVAEPTSNAVSNCA